MKIIKCLSLLFMIITSAYSGEYSDHDSYKSSPSLFSVLKTSVVGLGLLLAPQADACVVPLRRTPAPTPIPPADISKIRFPSTVINHEDMPMTTLVKQNSINTPTWKTVVNNDVAVNVAPFTTYLNNALGEATYSLPNGSDNKKLGDMYTIIGTNVLEYSINIRGGSIYGPFIYNDNSYNTISTSSTTLSITLMCITTGSQPRYAIVSTNGEPFTVS